MAKERVPNWFVWTTTIGLAAVIALLMLDYTAVTSNVRTNYAMMQQNADMNMMGDYSVSDDEFNDMMDDRNGMQKMMNGMMG